MLCLKIDPELRSRPKRAGKQPRGLGRHASLPSDELVDPLNGDTQMLGERDLGYPKWLQEVLEQGLPRVGWDSLAGQHHISSVIVNDRDLMGIAGLPSKHDPPLVIHPDAVLASRFATKGLQPVPRRRAEVPDRDGGVELIQLPHGDRSDARRDPPDRLAAFAME